MELCANLNDKPQLVFTGVANDCPTALEMEEFAEILHPDFSIQVDTTTRRTHDHPVGIRELVQSKRIILCTSATHIPRSMGVFRKAGYDPVAYPVDYRYPKRFTGYDLIPSVRHVYMIQMAMYEYQAMVLYWLKG